MQDPRKKPFGTQTQKQVSPETKGKVRVLRNRAEVGRRRLFPVGLILVLAIIAAFRIGLPTVSKLLSIDIEGTQRQLVRQSQPDPRLIPEIGGQELSPAPGTASGLHRSGILLPFGDDRELLVRGNRFQAPLNRVIVVDSASGWGAFRLTKDGQSPTATMRCESVFQSDRNAPFDHSDAQAVEQQWQESPAKLPGGTPPRGYQVPFTCGPIRLLWSPLDWIELTTTPELALTLAPVDELDQLATRPTDVLWIVARPVESSRPTTASPFSYPGAPPEPTE